MVFGQTSNLRGFKMKNLTTGGGPCGTCCHFPPCYDAKHPRILGEYVFDFS